MPPEKQRNSAHLESATVNNPPTTIGGAKLSTNLRPGPLNNEELARRALVAAEGARSPRLQKLRQPHRGPASWGALTGSPQRRGQSGNAHGHAAPTGHRGKFSSPFHGFADIAEVIRAREHQWGSALGKGADWATGGTGEGYAQGEALSSTLYYKVNVTAPCGIAAQRVPADDHHVQEHLHAVPHHAHLGGRGMRPAHRHFHRGQAVVPRQVQRPDRSQIARWSVAQRSPGIALAEGLKSALGIHKWQPQYDSDNFVEYNSRKFPKSRFAHFEHRSLRRANLWRTRPRLLLPVQVQSYRALSLLHYAKRPRPNELSLQSILGSQRQSGQTSLIDQSGLEGRLLSWEFRAPGQRHPQLRPAIRPYSSVRRNLQQRRTPQISSCPERNPGKALRNW